MAAFGGGDLALKLPCRPVVMNLDFKGSSL